MRDERTERDHAPSLRGFQGGRRTLDERGERGRHGGEGSTEHVRVECVERLSLRVAGIRYQLIKRAEARERLMNHVFGGAAFGQIAEHCRTPCAVRTAIGGDLCK